MSWVVWSLMLLAQNASFTWVSRARNSKSVSYHALASAFSNGTWFICLMIGVDKIVAAKQSHSWQLIVATVAFYVCFTVIGSVSMHWFLMKYIERGKRKVG